MMTRSILIINLLMVIAAQSLYSQSITNVLARVEGNSIVISYQLQSIDIVDISLYVSEDGGRNFSGPLKYVSGDIGNILIQGSKRIVWDVLKERKLLHVSDIVFRVKAESIFGKLHDPRDGKTYKTVKIGQLVWMAENLAYRPSSGNYWAYDNNISNVPKYGYLYDWQTACNVCPSGWHLPKNVEWTYLINFVGFDSGTKLKASSGWRDNVKGTDVIGFSALPGGIRSRNSNFYSLGQYGYWWSSSAAGISFAWGWSMSYNLVDVVNRENDDRFGYSVRCVKDN